MKLSLLMVLVAVLAQVNSQWSCGLSSELQKESGNRGRIVGGKQVKDCSVIPWQVGLLIQRPGGSSICGGSLISDRHVLTAAHCLDRIRDESQVWAYLGEYSIDEYDEHQRVRGIKKITRHPKFEKDHDDSDVAVLTLETPMERNNPCIKPICLDRSFPLNGKTCIASGWGSAQKGGDNADKLKMVKLKTYAGPNCKREFNIQGKDYVTSPKKMICAGHKQGGRDTCEGDSGGPLVCWNRRTKKFVQVGVVSFGITCGDKRLPGVYTRVSYFNNWIRKVMRENP